MYCNWHCYFNDKLHMLMTQEFRPVNFSALFGYKTDHKCGNFKNIALNKWLYMLGAACYDHIKVKSTWPRAFSCISFTENVYCLV